MRPIQSPKPSSLAPVLMPLSIIRMLWKRRVLIALTTAVLGAVAVFIVHRLPSVYQAQALVLVDSQKIPDRYVSTAVVSDVQDRVSVMTQQILTSDRLQKVILAYDLYPAARRTRAPEDVLALMRADLTIAPERSTGGRAIGFRVGYQGYDPVVVSRVANEVAGLFVADNLRSREGQVVGTSDFIETQLREAKTTLDALEATVTRYKLQHNGELPQQEGALDSVLSRLGTQLEANRDAMNRAQQQKVMLRESLKSAEDSESSMRRSRQAAPPVVVAATAAARKRSEDLSAQLADLELRYRADHPDVKRLRANLQQARAEEAKQAAAAPAAAARVQAASSQVDDVPDLVQARERISSLKQQIDAADRELETRQKDQQRILAEIASNQAHLRSLPIREQEMSGLTRDYEISKANYRSLLDKKIAAGMAADVEKRDQAERFTITDPARPPLQPFKPKRAQLDAAALLFCLACGIALGIGMEIHDASLLGEWELPAGLTILGRLPYIEIPPSAEPMSDGSGGSRLSRTAAALPGLALLSALLRGKGWS
jgi:polysaccharide biosynthesis transport protein